MVAKKERLTPRPTSQQRIKNNQLHRVKQYFDRNASSRLMCSESLGVRISNVCWLVDMLFDSNEIKVVGKDYCAISGELVQFLSCNRDLWPEEDSMQLKLFEEGGRR
jgi:hypothetical protein